MKHFLIVGGGVAGTSVAFHLLETGCKVTLVDSGENHSSRVAAGQINPIVFRRMTKSWRVDDFLPFARNFYEDLEKKTKKSILADKPIRRIFAHEQEREEWIKRQESAEFAPYLHLITEEDMAFSEAKNLFGSGRVKQSFYVKATSYLSALQQFIETHENGNWITQKIDYNDIDPTQTNWMGNSYDGILFCEGYLNQNNPYFNFLPVYQTKGEILTVQSDIYDKESLNRKCFVLPQGGGRYRVGANYDWNNADPTPSEKAKEEISQNLSSLVNNSFHVVDHQAGIRPTTRDRRPIMGEHPDIKGFFIFNGLGSKGYLLAPLLAKEMVDFVLFSRPLNKEQSLLRFG